MIAHSDLTKDTPLETLKAARTAWLNAASHDGTIDKIVEIGRELGLPVPGTYSRIFTTRYTNLEISVIYTCKTGQFMPERGEYKVLESCGVRIIDTSGESQVMSWGHGKDFFIPGKWTEKVLVCYEAAQAVKTGRDKAAIEKERQALLDELLIGKGI